LTGPTKDLNILEIGNDQLFQTKLETAVAEGKLKILISKAKLSDILILPFIIIGVGSL
jgi:cell division protease FtsH